MNEVIPKEVDLFETLAGMFNPNKKITVKKLGKRTKKLNKITL